MVELLPSKQVVAGSSPVSRSTSVKAYLQAARKLPPDGRIVTTLVTTPPVCEAVLRFVHHRQATKGLTPRGEEWLRDTLGRFGQAVELRVHEVAADHLLEFLSRYNSHPFRKHSFFRALRSFWKWACSEYRLETNPMAQLPAPNLPDRVLPTIPPGAVTTLIEAATNLRDKCIVVLLADTGARRSELASVKVRDVDLASRRITVNGKGNKEGSLVFGERTAELLGTYLAETLPRKSLFGLTSNGIRLMLTRLERQTGIKCNAHAFRRGFATSLRRAGVGDLDIMQLGRWSSLEMVRRYTKAYTFEDAAKRYKPIVT